MALCPSRILDRSASSRSSRDLRHRRAPASLTALAHSRGGHRLQRTVWQSALTHVLSSTPLQVTAALSVAQMVPARPGEGSRLPFLARLAAATMFTQVTVTRYGKTATISAATVTCLRHSVFGASPHNRES